MNIFVIHGSMRKGNTYKVTQEVIKNLKSHPDVQVDEMFVSQLKLPFCTSCHTCFEWGKKNAPTTKLWRR